MRLEKKHLAGALFGAALVFLAACAGEGPTAPEEGHTAIPQLAYSFDNCAAWSCSMGQCSRDPAVWGACCVAVTDPGEPAAPRPSCGGPTYCQMFPSRCSAQNTSFNPPSYCFNANASDICYSKWDATPDGEPAPTGCEFAQFSDYSECFVQH